MINLIADESKTWSTTDNDAHCLVLCHMQERIIRSMGLMSGEATTGQSEHDETIGPDETTGGSEASGLTTPEDEVRPSSNEVSDADKALAVKARWRAPQANRPAGREALVCRH